MSEACETVLVIEDDEAILNAIKEVLEIEGYCVLTAPDGKQALEILKTIVKPCLILLDMMLPIMNGWQFMDELKKAGRMLAAIPIVITSAAGNTILEDAVKKAQGYIKKPIDIDLLLDTVKKFCGTPIPE